MDKIYIVKQVWSYDGCPDDYENCYEEDIERVFDSNIKAAEYILSKIKTMFDEKLKILDVASSIDKSKCCREKCDNCIGCRRYISLDKLPSIDEIIEKSGIDYNKRLGAINSYTIEEHRVY